MYYTGVGSRETPEEVMLLFVEVAKYLAKQGYILRSGCAKGADTAFEEGCDIAEGDKEIYLPWESFEGSSSKLVISHISTENLTAIETSKKAYTLASQFHPYWKNLSQGAKKLQARNGHQLLGKDLNTPSKFVLCWTPNGSGSGGTGQAIRIAKHYKIPVFDAGNYKLENLRKEILIFLGKNMK